MPTEVDKQQRREHVIDAAFRVIARDGLCATTMRAVAAEAGATIGLINHWFDSREELIEASFDRAIEIEMTRAAELAADDPSSYIDAASQFLPIDARRRDEVHVWMAFYAMVVTNPDYAERGRARCNAVRTTMLGGLRQYFPTGTCHDIIDRCFVLVDGIAINAALDPKRWTRSRQLAVLREGLEDALARRLNKSPTNEVPKEN